MPHAIPVLPDLIEAVHAATVRQESLPVRPLWEALVEEHLNLLVFSPLPLGGILGSNNLDLIFKEVDDDVFRLLLCPNLRCRLRLTVLHRPLCFFALANAFPAPMGDI